MNKQNQAKRSFYPLEADTRENSFFGIFEIFDTFVIFDILMEMLFYKDHGLQITELT